MPFVYRLERIQPPPPLLTDANRHQILSFTSGSFAGSTTEESRLLRYQSRRRGCRERQLLATLLTSGSETTSPICRQRSITCRRFRTMSPPARSPSSTRSASSTPEHHPWAMATKPASGGRCTARPNSPSMVSIWRLMLSRRRNRSWSSLVGNHGGGGSSIPRYSYTIAETSPAARRPTTRRKGPI